MALPRVTIESLSEDVLFEIFYLYQFVVYEEAEEDPWKRHKLIHVCRRWRCIVFASQHRLNLELVCTPKTPVRKLLNIWPALPLDIQFRNIRRDICNLGATFDDFIAALEHHDRIHRIHILGLPSSLFDLVATMVQEPLPVLKSLSLWSKDRALRVPDTFLNGSAPSMRHLSLMDVSFPSLPKLLLSTSDLTSLQLWKIPNTGYISPEVMAACLSTLTQLETLLIKFESPSPHPKRRSRPPPPLTRTFLSALTRFEFRGVSEWLEVLAARIEVPLLHLVVITFFNQLVFDIPQISRFVGHPELPKLPGLSLRLRPHENTAHILFSWPRAMPFEYCHFSLEILCNRLDWQVFSIAQICTHILPLCSGVEWLNIGYDYWSDKDPPPLGIRLDDMEPARWLELFHSFTSVQRLVISAQLEHFIAAALQGFTGEEAAEVLPTLHKLFIQGPTTDRATQQAIRSFVTAREHSDHPIELIYDPRPM
jgi:hypothetical protein